MVYCLLDALDVLDGKLCVYGVLILRGLCCCGIMMGSTTALPSSASYNSFVFVDVYVCIYVCCTRYIYLMHL